MQLRLGEAGADALRRGPHELHELDREGARLHKGDSVGENRRLPTRLIWRVVCQVCVGARRPARTGAGRR